MSDLTRKRTRRETLAEKWRRRGFVFAESFNRHLERLNGPHPFYRRRHRRMAGK